MPFDPDRNPVKRHGAARRKNPHAKSTLRGPGNEGLPKGSHDGWNRATAPVQTMEGKLVKGQTGARLAKKKRKGRWSGFVYDHDKNRKRRGVGLVRLERPSDVELYGTQTEDPRRARVRARIAHLRNLRPY